MAGPSQPIHAGLRPPLSLSIDGPSDEGNIERERIETWGMQTTPSPGSLRAKRREADLRKKRGSGSRPRFPVLGFYLPRAPR